MPLRSLPPVHRLHLATVTLPDWHPEAANQPTAPVYGYVIDHPDGSILFDTGVGFGNELIDELYAPSRARLDASLDAVGIDAPSLVCVVNSHLHFDHSGQNPLFYGTHVPFYVRQLEIDVVEGDPSYTDPAWSLPPVAQRRLVDGDVEIAEGVSIWSTPGHTPGHQSVVIESVEGREVLAGQLVWESDEFVDEQVTVATSSPRSSGSWQPTRSVESGHSGPEQCTSRTAAPTARPTYSEAGARPSITGSRTRRGRRVSNDSANAALARFECLRPDHRSARSRRRGGAPCIAMTTVSPITAW